MMTASLLAVDGCRMGNGTRGAGDGADRPELIALEVSRNSYAPGDLVSLTLTNNTNRRYGFNPCPRIVERLGEGGVWSPISEPLRACTLELRLLDPHTSRTTQTELPDVLAEGTYRLVIPVTLETGEPDANAPASVRATSNIFSVSS